MKLKTQFFNRADKSSYIINSVIEKGQDLEQAGKDTEAYFLYRGLVAAYPDCKACRSHMGKTKAKLDHQGIQITITDTLGATARQTVTQSTTPPATAPVGNCEI